MEKLPYLHVHVPITVYYWYMYSLNMTIRMVLITKGRSYIITVIFQLLSTIFCCLVYDQHALVCFVLGGYSSSSEATFNFTSHDSLSLPSSFSREATFNLTSHDSFFPSWSTLNLTSHDCWLSREATLNMTSYDSFYFPVLVVKGGYS